MSEFDPKEILGQMADSLRHFSESVRVIGEPLEVAGKVIVPAVVAKVAYGAGGGGGSQQKAEGDETPRTESGAGGGGGGFINLSPVFLVVDAEGERLHTVPSAAQSLMSAADKLGESLGELFHRKPRHDEPEEAEDEGDEEQ